MGLQMPDEVFLKSLLFLIFEGIERDLFRFAQIASAEEAVDRWPRRIGGVREHVGKIFSRFLLPTQ